MNKVIWTQEKKDRAIQAITKYLEVHGPAECIMQSDEALIEAPEVLSFIADGILVYGVGLVYEDESEE